jgi:predicted nucleic acid-binding protein
VKRLVFNSTPLIYLIKAGLSELIGSLKEEKLTCPRVKVEVVDKGKLKGVPDAVVLEKLFDKGVFKLYEPKDRTFLSILSLTSGLHIADAEVLALAREYDALAVVDDEVARKTAKVYGIGYVGTPYVLMRAVFEGIISKEEAKRAVNTMVSSGWRCSVESYIKITDLLEKL